MVSRIFKGSAMAMSEEKIKFYGMLANFKAEIMKMGEKERKRELQLRREKRHLKKYEVSVKNIYDYLLRVICDAKTGAYNVGNFAPLMENIGSKDFLKRIEELPTMLEFKMDKTIGTPKEELKEIDKLLGTCSLDLLEGQTGRKKKELYEEKVVEMRGKEEDFKILNDNERAAQFETNRKETERLTKQREAVEKEKRVQQKYRKETKKGKRELEGMTEERYKKKFGQARSQRR